MLTAGRAPPPTRDICDRAQSTRAKPRERQSGLGPSRRPPRAEAGRPEVATLSTTPLLGCTGLRSGDRGAERLKERGKRAKKSSLKCRGAQQRGRKNIDLEGRGCGGGGGRAGRPPRSLSRIGGARARAGRGRRTRGWASPPRASRRRRPPREPGHRAGCASARLGHAHFREHLGAAWTDEKRRMGRKSNTGFVHRLRKAKHHLNSFFGQKSGLIYF